MAEIDMLRIARNEGGFPWKTIAHDAGVTYDTLLLWRRGNHLVPEHKWKALGRALGVDPENFNRELYLQQFADLKNSAAQADKAQQAPKPAQMPASPPEPPKIAPVAPPQSSGGWFDDAEPAPAPEIAPDAAPEKSNGFWSGLFDGDDDA